MVYTIAVDARAIEESQQLGEAGISIVASFLNSLDQNCLLIECRRSVFSCESLINAVETIVESSNNEYLDFSTRNRLKATLKKMRLSNRVKSYRVEKLFEHHDSPAHMMLSLANVVDQVIVTRDCAPAGKSVTLPRFAHSPFEWKRSKTCSEGVSKKRSECHVVELLEVAFKTLITWSDQICLIDYSLGQNWFVKNNERNSNYIHAIPHWCSFLKSLERETQVVIRTLAPREFEHGGQECRNLIAEIEQQFMYDLESTSIHVKVELSDKVHSRFFYSCGFFIDIDRGIDICYKNGRVRRTSFGFKHDKELEDELR